MPIKPINCHLCFPPALYYIPPYKTWFLDRENIFLANHWVVAKRLSVCSYSAARTLRNLEPQNPSIDFSELYNIRWLALFGPRNCGNVWSGAMLLLLLLQSIALPKPTAFLVYMEDGEAAAAAASSTRRGQRVINASYFVRLELSRRTRKSPLSCSLSLLHAAFVSVRMLVRLLKSCFRQGFFPDWLD